MSRPTPPSRADYVHFLRIQTRWNDNDVYGHVNNVVYYAYMDTIINRYLIEQGGLDPHAGATIGLCVSSSCDYFAPAAYPDELDAGLAVEKLGGSSVTYRVGIFLGETTLAAGRFTHVFVARQERRPVPIAGSLRAALEALVRPS